MPHQGTRPEISPRSGAPAPLSSQLPTTQGQLGLGREAGSRLRPAAPKPASQPAQKLSSWRCREKGCVFPARPDGNGKCSYHRLQQLEPNLFESLQPTVLMLEQVKFGLPEDEPDDSRVVDRNRQAAERAAFLWEEAA
jgi:hypothetical protein